MKNISALLIASLALAGCNKTGEKAAPTGQVAATVKGDEITTSQVRLEMGGQAADPAAVAAQQPAALQSVINRKLLADAAIERGLDKSPNAAVLLDKARDLALVSLLEQSIRARVPKVSQTEADDYVRDNPDAFAQRRVVAVDELQVPQLPDTVLKQMAPLDTLEQVIALLDANKIPYRRGANAIDPLAIPPEAAKQLAKLNVGEVLVTPANGGATIARIREVSMQPVAGADASRVALNVVTAQRANGLLRQQFDAIIKAGTPSVKINPAFAPKKAK